LKNFSGNVKAIEAGMDRCLDSPILLRPRLGLDFSIVFVGMYANTSDRKPKRNVFLFNLRRDSGIE